MGEGALLAKHRFASARTHSRQRLGRAPEGDLQRPPQPDPPRHPTECTLLLLLRQVQGAALPNNPLLCLLAELLPVLECLRHQRLQVLDAGTRVGMGRGEFRR